MKTKVVIDARWMIGEYRGMGRYAFQLVESVKDQVIGLLPDNFSFEPLQYVAKGNSFFPWWEQIVLPKLVVESDANILICPYNTAPVKKSKDVKLVLVVHDLIFLHSWLELPPSMSIYQTLGRIYRRLIVPKVIKNADFLLTVSEYTKAELVSKFNIPASSIHVIPNVISDEWLSLENTALKERLPYLLSVSGEAPSKNVKRLIRAFSIAKQSLPPDYRLKILGVKSGYHEQFMNFAKKLKVNEFIDFIGFVDEEELITYYQQAKGFVFPSLFEGFGIPLLEAMASGVPITCSNTTSLPEVVGDNALLFDPLDVNDIAKNIELLINDKDNSEQLLSGALTRVNLYSSNTVKKQFKDFWALINGK